MSYEPMRHMDHAEITISWYAKNKDKLFNRDINELYISMGFPRAEEIANITTLQSISVTEKHQDWREWEEEGEEEEEVPNGKKRLLC